MSAFLSLDWLTLGGVVFMVLAAVFGVVFPK